MNSYVLMFVLFFSVLVGVSFYVWNLRKHVDEMHGMMVGMTLGMIAGLVSATLYLIPTGNFLYGVILGSFFGLLFGIPSGRLGGHLGIMEGVMAGPMGGMMGAMLGQMMRPFSIEVFMPFFAFIFLISMLGISYAVHCGVSCCGAKGKKPSSVSNSFVISWLVACVVLLLASVLLSFSIVEAASDFKLPSSVKSSDVNLPSYLQFKEERAESVVNGNLQEISMRIVNSAYSPNTLVVKKGVPLKINIKAEESAGCASEIVIPDFKIKKIVGPGSSGVIELMPEAEGEFKFHCSMDMARGKIIVE